MRIGAKKKRSLVGCALVPPKEEVLEECAEIVSTGISFAASSDGNNREELYSRVRMLVGG